MGAGSGKSRIVLALLGAMLLCGCTVAKTASKPDEPDPASVRLPIITPMKIQQPTDPPEPSVAPSDVEEGRARSLKMFQIDYDRGKQGPPVPEEPAGPSESETNL